MPESAALEFESRIQVPAAHPCLPGHFPGRPLVPAVLLLNCVVRALRERLGGLRLTTLQGAKFLLPVLPEARVDLQIRADLSQGRAHFRIEFEGRLAAQGALGFVRD